MPLQVIIFFYVQSLVNICRHSSVFQLLSIPESDNLFDVLRDSTGKGERNEEEAEEAVISLLACGFNATTQKPTTKHSEDGAKGGGGERRRNKYRFVKADLSLSVAGDGDNLVIDGGGGGDDDDGNGGGEGIDQDSEDQLSAFKDVVATTTSEPATGASSNAAKRHVRKDEKRKEARRTGKAFNLAMADGEAATAARKSFDCPVDGCTFAASYAKDLKRHMRKHTGWFPYIAYMILFPPHPRGFTLLIDFRREALSLLVLFEALLPQGQGPPPRADPH